MKHPRASKTPSILPPSLQHQLNMYALAASAAGVSLLAVAQPSEAKIVYTKTHQTIGNNGVYQLDLNHDGTVDFLIQESRSSSYGYALFAHAALGNAVQGSVSQGRWHVAAALKKGAPIGRGQGFAEGRYDAMVAFTFGTGGTTFETGYWVNVRNRYLGLKFKIGGTTHYGWARLSVQVQGSKNTGNLKITGTLTGYAYETIPGKEINAGQTDDDAGTAGQNTVNFDVPRFRPSADSPVSDIQRSASLGSLALGVQGIPLGRQWR